MSEMYFRVAFSTLWAILSVIVIWVSFSARGASGRQSTGRARWMRIAAIAFAVLYFSGAILYALLPSYVTLLTIPLPNWLRLAAVDTASLDILYLCWGYMALGKNWAPSVSGARNDSVLVTTGLYNYLRHPIYLGVFIFLGSLALVAANWFILLSTVTLLALLYASIVEEEISLIDRFGDEYREYMKRTPRLIPILRQRHDSRKVTAQKS